MNSRVAALLAVFLLFGTSHALFINVNPVKDRAAPGGTFEYEITVLNSETTTKHITVQRTFISWESEATPYSFDLGPGASEVVSFKLYAPAEVETCGDDVLYQPSLYISDGEQSQKVPLLAIVGIPQSQRLYITSLDVTAAADPRENLPIGIVIDNGCMEAEMNVELSLLKDNRTYSRQNQTVFIYAGTDTYDLDMTLDPLTMPGSYQLSVRIYHRGNLVRQSDVPLEVTAYTKSEIVQETGWSLLGETVNVRVVNNGTLPVYNLTAVTAINMLERYFMYYSSPEAMVSDLSISWLIEELPVGGELVYTFSVTFVPLLLVPFIVIFVAFLVFLWTRKVIVIKDILDYRMESGSLRMKMQIRLHNVHKGPIFNVKISELLHPMASGVAGFGSLDGKVVTDAGGKRLQWHLDEIKPDEEVLLTYIIKTKLEILGPVELPPTYVTFENKHGKVFERKSNVVEITTVTGTVGS